MVRTGSGSHSVLDSSKPAPVSAPAKPGMVMLGTTDGIIPPTRSLAVYAGMVMSREQLLEEIRDRNYDVFDRSIDVHISALRKKLGDDPKEPRFIRTLRSAGYMLVNPEAEL